MSRALLGVMGVQLTLGALVLLLLEADERRRDRDNRDLQAHYDAMFALENGAQLQALRARLSPGPRVPTLDDARVGDFPRRWPMAAPESELASPSAACQGRCEPPDGRRRRGF